MSDMLNHYYCGRESINRFPADSLLQQMIFEHYDTYILGTQGPDFFYYDLPVVPLHKPNNPFGSMIHTRGVNLFFYHGFRFAEENPEYRNEALAYLAGFMCHHSLDVASHPYIFYRTGRFDRQHIQTHIFSYLHKYYEVLLDVAFLQERYGRLAAAFDFNRLFSPDKETKKMLEAFYAYTIRHTYGREIRPGGVRHSLMCAKLLSIHFPDFDSAKKAAIQKIEERLDKKYAVSRAFYPSFTDDRAVLNLDHRTWLDPVTGAEHTESYPELFDSAVDVTSKRFAAVDDMFASGEPITLDFCQELFENRSYLTGIPCNEKQKMTHFDIFFDLHH